MLKDVPPLSVVIGNPGRVIKRYSTINMLGYPLTNILRRLC